MARESRPTWLGYITAEERGGRGLANFSGSRKQRARITRAQVAGAPRDAWMQNNTRKIVFCTHSCPRDNNFNQEQELHAMNTNKTRSRKSTYELLLFATHNRLELFKSIDNRLLHLFYSHFTFSARLTHYVQ